MKQIKKPAHQQFEESTFCYLEQLFRLAYARVGNTQDAEDILQETYLKAYRSFDSLKQRTRIKSWLTQILINSVHDYRRKGLRTLATVDISEIPEDSAQAIIQIGPEEQICREEIDPLLTQALNSIPDIFLMPLLLREIHEASYYQIGTILDIPKGTVMSRLSRARGLLRKSLLPKLVSDSATLPGAKNGDSNQRGLCK